MLALERIIAWPTVYNHKPSIAVSIGKLMFAESGAFEAVRMSLRDAARSFGLECAEVQRAESPAGLVGEVAVQLQTFTGYDAHDYDVFPAGTQTDRLVIGAPDRMVGQLAIKHAFQAVAALAVPTTPQADERAREALVAYLRSNRRDVTNGAASYACTAERLGLPWHRLGETRALSIGHGHKRRLFFKQGSPRTSSAGMWLSDVKHASAAVLRAAGLPVPGNALVSDERAALAAFDRLEKPVVVKPVAGSKGTAVTTELRSPEEVKRAFTLARQHGQVIVEEQIEGTHHRLLVIGGRFVSARSQKNAHVVGDGSLTVEELIRLANQGRTAGVSVVGKKLPLDNETVANVRKQGFEMQSIPDRGTEVFIRFHSNLAVGSVPKDVTDEVHPDNRRMAEQAAALIELDVAGVDFITTDITRSWLEVGGGICEVNWNPGFTMHGDRDAREREFLGIHFPDGESGRIPIATILSDPESDEAVRAFRAFAGRHWQSPGFCTSSGVWITDRHLTKRFPNQPEGLHALLLNQQVDAAFLFTSMSALTERGLGADKADVAVMLPVQSQTGDHQFERSVLKLILATHSDLVLSARSPVLHQVIDLAVEAESRLWLCSENRDASVDLPDRLLPRTCFVHRDEGAGGVTIERQGKRTSLKARADGDREIGPYILATEHILGR